MSIHPARICAYTLTTTLGHGCDPHIDSLAAMRTGLKLAKLDDCSVSWLGIVAGLDDHRIDAGLAEYDCRNNRLADLALNGDDFTAQVNKAVLRHGPHRVGIFLGTSTSGIRHTEYCYREHFKQGTTGLGPDLRFDTTHAYVSVADFCRRRLSLTGPALVISTACSSGAKTFASAHRALVAGLCDAAIVGGVDTLCASTLMGFDALGLLSSIPCAPWAHGRTGISLGEGAAFALLDLEPTNSDDLALLGCGESNDAYHITRPHPEGLGAVMAMRWALASAGLAVNEIDYINLHGTGTQANDASEDCAVNQVFGGMVPVSATKGWTGHTLGASGAVEAVLSLLCIKHGLMPGTLNTEILDPALSAPLVRRSVSSGMKRVLSNSFGFGGNNCAIVLGRP